MCKPNVWCARGIRSNLKVYSTYKSCDFMINSKQHNAACSGALSQSSACCQAWVFRFSADSCLSDKCHWTGDHRNVALQVLLFLHNKTTCTHSGLVILVAPPANCLSWTNIMLELSSWALDWGSPTVIIIEWYNSGRGESNTEKQWSLTYHNV